MASCLLERNFFTPATFQSKRCMKYVTFNWIYILKAVKQNLKIAVVKDSNKVEIISILHLMNKSNNDFSFSL
jgi:hypothetical protein